MGLIGTVGNIDKIVIGSTELVDITNLICVGATVYGIGVAARYSTLRAPFGTAGYQVTAGKTFRILAVRLQNLVSGTGATNCGWGYADNDVGLSTATVPTTPVAANILPGPDRNITGTSTVGGKFNVPAQKYMYVLSDGGDSNLSLYGYEV